MLQTIDGLSHQPSTQEFVAEARELLAKFDGRPPETDLATLIDLWFFRGRKWEHEHGHA